MQPRLGTAVLEIALAAMEGRSKTEQGDEEEAVTSVLMSDAQSTEKQKQGRAKDGAGGGPKVAEKAAMSRGKRPDPQPCEQCQRRGTSRPTAL